MKRQKQNWDHGGPCGHEVTSSDEKNETALPSAIITCITSYNCRHAERKTFNLQRIISTDTVVSFFQINSLTNQVYLVS